MTRTRDFIGLGGWLAVSFVAGAIGAVASADAASFYRALDRPAWAPSPAVFGPVWTVLYILIAIAAWLVWRTRGFDGARAALGLFIAQLAANALWTWIFFAWRDGLLALLEILLLWILVLATTVAFWRIRRLAGALLLPYLAWVSFAAALTFEIWRLNAGSLS